MGADVLNVCGLRKMLNERICPAILIPLSRSAFPIRAMGRELVANLQPDVTAHIAQPRFCLSLSHVRIVHMSRAQCTR